MPTYNNKQYLPPFSPSIIIRPDKFIRKLTKSNLRSTAQNKNPVQHQKCV
nr:MAG TPA: hypothetical protein [Bacteriophage sp.]